MGGNSKTLMFVTISPANYNLGETICSLNFASRCRNVELGQAKKQMGSISNSSSSSHLSNKYESSSGQNSMNHSLSGDTLNDSMTSVSTSTLITNKSQTQTQSNLTRKTVGTFNNSTNSRK